MVTNYGKANNSFSGVDIKVVFAEQVIAETQAISYSITREKAPIYTMGASDPRSFSRGKRGIAGTAIFIVFDRHALVGALGAYSSNPLQFLSDIDDVFPDGSTIKEDTDLSTIVLDPTQSVALAESDLTSVASDQELANAWYIDQMPAVDITLAAANEHGALAVMKIFGAEWMNEGCGVSIDDIVTEQQTSYAARSVLPWKPLGISKKMTVE